MILSVVLALELSAAIAAYSQRTQVAAMLDDRLRDTMPYYYENNEIQDAFDFIQERVSSSDCYKTTLY